MLFNRLTVQLFSWTHSRILCYFFYHLAIEGSFMTNGTNEQCGTKTHIQQQQTKNGIFSCTWNVEESIGVQKISNSVNRKWKGFWSIIIELGAALIFWHCLVALHSAIALRLHLNWIGSWVNVVAVAIAVAYYNFSIENKETNDFFFFVSTASRLLWELHEVYLFVCDARGC